MIAMREGSHQKITEFLAEIDQNYGGWISLWNTRLQNRDISVIRDHLMIHVDQRILVDLTDINYALQMPGITSYVFRSSK